jgi:hypothetical protein
MEREDTIETQLMNVSGDGAMLKMLDSTSWQVSPTAMPICTTWVPMAQIKIVSVDPASVWPYKLTNVDNRISVRAAQIE